MAKLLRQVSDFIIKVVMMFTTCVVLLFLAKEYPQNSFTYGFLALLFVLSLLTKSLVDIFSKD